MDRFGASLYYPGLGLPATQAVESARTAPATASLPRVPIQATAIPPTAIPPTSSFTSVIQPAQTGPKPASALWQSLEPTVFKPLGVRVTIQCEEGL